ncbi:hypothetical protein GCM10027605_61490 [Micromonospora zhanjiangensis]
MIHSRLGKLFTVLLAGVLGGLLLALAALPAMTLYGFGLNALTAPYGGCPATCRPRRRPSARRCTRPTAVP